MSQEDADELGSISSGEIEPPPDDNEDVDDYENDAAAGGDDNNNETAEGEALSSIPTGVREKRAQAAPVAPKTNIDARLTEAQQSYTPDPNRKRSKDVGVLTTKFRQFRVHLTELKPIIKTYQQAHKELHDARTKVSRQ